MGVRAQKNIRERKRKKEAEAGAREARRRGRLDERGGEEATQRDGTEGGTRFQQVCSASHHGCTHCHYVVRSGSSVNGLELVKVQFLVDQLSGVVVSSESSHGFKGFQCVICVGLFPSTPSRSQAFW